MKRKVILLLFSLFVFLALPAPVFANSAEPPCLVVLVENPPEDLEITLEFDGGLSLDPLPLHRVFKAWEGYYRFYGADGVEEPEGLTGARLLVETGGEGFAVPLDAETFFTYNNLLTLDLDTRTLETGQPWWRTPLLVSLRLLSTLALEGLVFLLFGYREKRSWKVFLLTNLVTQLGVNLCILYFLSPSPVSGGVNWLHNAFLYTPMEILVLLIEMAVFGWYLDEQSKGEARGCAVAANLSSWVLGGVLLTVLPI